MTVYKLDILAKEKDENLPYWLDPSQKHDKDSPSRQAIRDKHRARWLAERDAKREKSYLEWLAKGRFIQDPTTGKLQGSEPGAGHGEGEGGDGGAGEGVSEGGVDKYGLSAKDRAVVYDWMGSGYRQLRTDPSFGKTVEKLPAATGRFFHGTRLTPKDAASFKAGQKTTLSMHTSTSDRRNTAIEFMESQRHDSAKSERVLFEINGAGHRIPRPLAELAGVDAEAEVVLSLGGRFKVNEVEKDAEDDDGNKFTRITMSQINA
jgi:hypothetical protein